ncbi:MAG TPA: DNA-formamidopyrimidine glycosylase family protein, partial [Gammaproteobacteria bacterium]|nr:DNA-formamidopyrimidine glycosylase family protein [Gammaproteobacteria bacterium]
MPELPEVQTTVDGVNDVAKGLTITDVWTDYNSLFHANNQNIKNPDYFLHFKKDVTNSKIINSSRKGKNVLIHIKKSSSKDSKTKNQENTILIHMKMTGHLMYGKYIFTPDSKTGTSKGSWEPEEKTGPLRDPYNKFLHLVFTLSNGKHLVFSDMRKFAKVFMFKTSDEHEVIDLMHLGPDPLSPEYTYTLFKEQILKRPTGKIKQVLMDQTIIAGIGNIYSDEILWEAGVHPES